MIDLRKPFIEMMSEFASKDPRIILVVGDVGFNYMEPYIKKYPSQFLNAGVAEQNMMGVAVGLAKGGWKPYIYTMINFILFRPYEQMRNDICYQNVNVKLFGVQGSAAYKFLGFSHNVIEGEEEGLLSRLPNINYYFPNNEEGVKEVMRNEYKRLGPAYVRI